jgi:hypothetical protein
MTKIQKVKAVTDDSGHWYVIPYIMADVFYEDLEDESLVDSGKFDDKWGCYRTGGDLNSIQLWAEIETDIDKTVIAEFCDKISIQQDCPSDFQEIINKDFWNLY